MRENSYSDTVIKLASCEVIEHNKKDLERVISNENHKIKNRDVLSK